MLKYRTSPTLVLAALVTATAVTVATLDGISMVPARAQSAPSFTMPETVPQGTRLKISSGSESMAALSTVLKTGFEGQFAGSKIAVETVEANTALQSLIKGQADLAAISRPLTPAEKAQGLVEVPAKRIKIALVVGTDNAFKGGLSSTQFADIFRGKITNWSAVGGPAGPIRFIDRPNTDVRLSLASYPVFQSAPFQAGSTATQLEDNSPPALVSALGKDGISYAPLTEVQGLAGVRTLELHQTPPTDARYPFSQPFSFVYKGQPSPAIAAFLGYATSEAGQAEMTQVDLVNPAATLAALSAPAEDAVEATGDAAPTAETAAGVTEGATGSEADDRSETANDAMGDSRGGLADAVGRRIITGFQQGQGWWLLLPVVLLGLLIWAATRRLKREAAAETGAVAVTDDLFGDVAIADDTDDDTPLDLNFDDLDTDNPQADFILPSLEQAGLEEATVAGGMGVADWTVTQGTATSDTARWSALAEGVRGRLYGMPEDANGTVQVGVDAAVEDRVDPAQAAWQRENYDASAPGLYGIRGMTDRIMGAPSEWPNPTKSPASPVKTQANPSKTQASELGAKAVNLETSRTADTTVDLTESAMDRHGQGRD